MPSVSEKQRVFTRAAAHNPKFAKKAGISVSVAKEFEAADKRAPNSSPKKRRKGKYD